MKAARIAYFKRPGHYKQLQGGYTGNYLCDFNSDDFFLAIFSPVASPVQGWLHVRFSSRAGDATKFEKIAHVAAALGP